jgi:hypothetical protein
MDTTKNSSLIRTAKEDRSHKPIHNRICHQILKVALFSVLTTYLIFPKK